MKRNAARAHRSAVALLAEGLRLSHRMIDGLRVERGERPHRAIGHTAQLRERAASLPRVSATPHSALARTVPSEA